MNTQIKCTAFALLCTLHTSSLFSAQPANNPSANNPSADDLSLVRLQLQTIVDKTKPAQSTNLSPFDQLSASVRLQMELNQVETKVQNLMFNKMNAYASKLAILQEKTTKLEQEKIQWQQEKQALQNELNGYKLLEEKKRQN